MTTVTVVIDNHDYETYLAAAIDSSLGQTWHDVQVVVVDDGSTDGSAAVIAGYGHAVRAVLKRNGGQASAFNAGLQVATGEVVIFLDADDVLLPNAAEVAATVFDGRPDLVKLSWPMSVINSAGRPTGSLHPAGELPVGDLADQVRSQGADCYLSPPTSGNAWSRTFLEKVGAVPEPPFRRGADGFFIVTAPLFGLVDRVSEPLSCYRVHGDNGFWGGSLEQRTSGALERHHARSTALREVLERLGEPLADPEAWHNPYIDWLRRIDRTVATVRSVVPRAAPYLLIDGGEWGPQLLTGARAVYFTQRDGVYWGPPADDIEVQRTLDHALADGVRHVVVGWPAAWCVEHYPALRRFLGDDCRCLVQTEDVTVHEVTVPRCRA